MAAVGGDGGDGVPTADAEMEAGMEVEGAGSVGSAVVAASDPALEGAT